MSKLHKTVIEPEPNDRFIDDLDLKILLDTLKSRRIEYEMTTDEVGERLGVSGQTILNWEAGKHTLKVADLYEWCRVVGLRLMLGIEVQT